jgi:hypothetical protein
MEFKLGPTMPPPSRPRAQIWGATSIWLTTPALTRRGRRSFPPSPRPSTPTSHAADASPEAKYRLTFPLKPRREISQAEINAGSLSGIVVRISSIDVPTEV